MSKANALLFLLFAANLYGSDIDGILGQQAKVVGEVQRYGWPRTDLRVTIDGVRVEPGLALGSWAAFGGGMVMGDLVMNPAELDAVVRELEKGGFEISAIHNHLAGESPSIVYAHYAGHGDSITLAQTLKSALSKTSTPMKIVPAVAAPSPSFDIVASILGRKGNVNGHVLQFSIPRAETITDGGMTIPPAMGVATAINFQAVGDRVATSGDFVLIADEVNPVIRELQAKGIRVTALHSHMLRESPRLLFMHFWGLGSPQTIAEGIRNALAKVNTK